MTIATTTNKKIIRLGVDNYLLLMGESFNKETMIDSLTRMISPTQGLSGRDSIFIDVGSLYSVDGIELLVSVASVKLFVEGDEVFIKIDFRDPANGSKIKTDKDRFIIVDLELSDVIEDIADSLMVVVDGYRKVVTYGC